MSLVMLPIFFVSMSKEAGPGRVLMVAPIIVSWDEGHIIIFVVFCLRCCRTVATTRTFLVRENLLHFFCRQCGGPHDDSSPISHLDLVSANDEGGGGEEDIKAKKQTFLPFLSLAIVQTCGDWSRAPALLPAPFPLYARIWWIQKRWRQDHLCNLQYTPAAPGLGGLHSFGKCMIFLVRGESVRVFLSLSCVKSRGQLVNLYRKSVYVFFCHHSYVCVCLATTDNKPCLQRDRNPKPTMMVQRSKGQSRPTFLAQSL